MYLFLTKIHQDGGPAVSPFGRMTNPRDVPSLLFKLGVTKNGKGGPADLRSLTVGVNPRLSRWSQSYHRSPETPGPLLRSEGRQPEARLALAGFGGGGRAYGQNCRWPLEASRDNRFSWSIQKDTLYTATLVFIFFSFFFSAGDGTRVSLHARQMLYH